MSAARLGATWLRMAAGPGLAGCALRAVLAGLALLAGAASAAPSASDWNALALTVYTDPAAAEAPLRERLALQPQPAAADVYPQFLLGWALAEQGKKGDALQVEGALAQAAGDSPRLAAACVRAAYARLYTSVRDATLALEPMLPEASPADPRLRIACHLVLAEAYGERGVPGAALRHLRLAQRLADTSGAPDWLRALTRSLLAGHLWAADETALAQRYGSEALALAQGAGQPAVLARVLGLRGRLLAGDPGQKAMRRRLFEQALVVARQAGDGRGTAAARLDLAQDDRARGQLERAEGQAHAAMAAAPQVLGPALLRAAEQQLALAQIAGGDLSGGLARARAAIVQWRGLDALGRVAQGLSDLGDALAQADQPQLAYETLRAQRQARDDSMDEDRQQAVAELQARLEGDILSDRQHALQVNLALQDERARQVRLRTQLMQIGVAALGLLLGLAAAAWWVARRRMQVRQAALVHLASAAAQDPLTGLANRAHAEGWMREAPRVGGGVFLIDVDRFKAINDSLGHAAGDAVLVELARRLQQAVRQGDLLARWGGEEFLLLTPRSGTGPDLALAARLLHDVAKTPIAGLAQPLHVSVSIGHAARRAGTTWAEALEAADAALYGAKLLGRNQAVGVRRPQPMPLDAAAAQAACVRGAWVSQPGPLTSGAAP